MAGFPYHLLPILRTRSGRDFDTVLVLFILLTALTGFYNRAGAAWVLPYRINIFLHPLLGMFLFGMLLIWSNKRATTSSFSGHARTEGPFLLLIAATALPKPHLAVFLLGLFALYSFHRFITGALMSERSEKEASFFFHFSRLIWVACFASAFGILFHYSEAKARTWFSLHAFSGILLCALIPLILRLQRRTTFIYAGLAVLILLLGQFPRSPVWRVNLSTVILNDRTEKEKDSHSKPLPDEREIRSLNATESCGGGGAAACHPGIVEDHLLSNHNIGLMSDYFQKNLAMMAEEVSQADTIICAGCHSPQGVFNPKRNFNDFKSHNNMSCVFCHSISDAGTIPELPGRYWYEFQPEIRHLAMFDSSGEPPLGFRKQQILLNAPGHARVFRRKLYREDRFCLSCHHLQMPAPVPLGLKNPRCVVCHMPSRKIFGGKDTRKSHLFPGCSIAAPFFQGYAERVETIRRWAGGEIISPMRGWEDLWQLRQLRTDPLKKAPWIIITFITGEDPQAGKPFKLQIMSSNAIPSHPFPAAPLDLAKAWLELRVKDAAGNLIYSSGGLNADGSIMENSVTLGGRMIRDDGAVITLNRVWRIREKEVEQIIPAGGHLKHSFEFAVPNDFKGPLWMDACWKYRKLNPKFVQWAYGAAEGKSLPPIVVGEASFVFPPQKREKD